MNRLLLLLIRKMQIKTTVSPDWCGSVGWATSHKTKDYQLDSRSGHAWAANLVPGPWSLVPGLGMCRRQPIAVSLPLFPPYP